MSVKCSTNGCNNRIPFESPADKCDDCLSSLDQEILGATERREPARNPMKIAIVRTNGTVELTTMGEGLQDIYNAIGNGCDMFQQLPIGNGLLLVDEEAKIRQNPPPDNAMATEFCARMRVGLDPSDRILGNMVLVGIRGSEFADIPTALLDSIIKFAGAERVKGSH